MGSCGHMVSGGHKLPLWSLSWSVIALMATHILIPKMTGNGAVLTAAITLRVVKPANVPA